jgi:hypothetical protein
VSISKDPEKQAETKQAPAATREHPLLEKTSDRVHYVADLMAANTWNERTSRRLQNDLAARWGVETSTIRNYSAEAGRSIKAAIAERMAATAQRAMDRLERIAAIDILSAQTVTVRTKSGKTLQKIVNVPGLPGAVVHANEVILKMTGFAEPDEDKFRPSTLVQVGQVVTSPVLTALLNGGKKQHVNGKEQSQGRAALDGAPEDPDGLPEPRRH